MVEPSSLSPFQACSLRIHHLCRDFEKLSVDQKILYIALAVIYSLGPLLSPAFGGFLTWQGWNLPFRAAPKKIPFAKTVESFGIPDQASVPAPFTAKTNCFFTKTGPSRPIDIPKCELPGKRYPVHICAFPEDLLTDGFSDGEDELIFPISGLCSPADSDDEIAEEEGEWISCFDLYVRMSEYQSQGHSPSGPMPVTKKQAKKILRSFCEEFPAGIKKKGTYGFIEKRDLPPGTKVFVRADLHGDLETLIGNIHTLMEEGFLDSDLHCQGTHLVFLGDYMDRGANGLNVLLLLAKLKLENKDFVHLIRGNHEDVLQNLIYGNSDAFFLEFTEDETDEEAFELLTQVYERLPLSLYLGSETEGLYGEYVQFSHGMFEIRQDVSDLLERNDTMYRVAVPKKQKFSPRVQEIDFDPDTDYESLLDQEKKQPMASPAAIRQIKLQAAAKRVSQLAKEEEVLRCEDDELTSYMWGDVATSGTKTSHLGTLMGREWKILPKDIKHCFRLNEGKAKVKLLLRGHEHVFRHHIHQGKVIATTLPVAMGCETKSPLEKSDKCYLFTLAPEVKGWTKRALTRIPGEPKIKFSRPYSIFSTET